MSIPLIPPKPKKENKESRSLFNVSSQDILEFINYTNKSSIKYPRLLQQITELKTDFLDIKVSRTPFSTDNFINELINVINENKNISTYKLELDGDINVDTKNNILSQKSTNLIELTFSGDEGFSQEQLSSLSGANLIKPEPNKDTSLQECKNFDIENVTSSQTIPVSPISENTVEKLSKQDSTELLRDIFNMPSEVVVVRAKQSHQEYWSCIIKYLEDISPDSKQIAAAEKGAGVNSVVLDECIMKVRLGKFINQLSDLFKINIAYLIITKIRNKDDYDRFKKNILGCINNNSALLIVQEDDSHSDSYIKDKDGDLICPYCFFLIRSGDDPEIYQNDIQALIEDDSNEDEVRFPRAQNDFISCYALNILYLHTLLTGGLSKSIKFTLMDEQGEISKHFFPCAEVLNFSQSNTHNQMMYDFVCSEEETFEIKLKNHETNQSERYIKKTLEWYLTKTLEYSKKYSDNNLTKETESLLKNLQNYRQTFKEDYNRVKNWRDLPFQIWQDAGYEKYGKHILKEKLFLMVDYMNKFIQ